MTEDKIMQINVKALAEKYEDELIETRRLIHQNPELSNEEVETTKLIRSKLEEYGVEIAEIGMKTGVVGVLRSGKPGKTIALRADIDALRMSEETGLSFASKHTGKCHSCGHDIHTAILIYCAKILSEIKDKLTGNVMFLFQPAEESGSGAQQLVACRFWEVLQPDVFVGLHTAPDRLVGSIAVKAGAANASADGFHIRIVGHGGHGAHPEKCIDPIMIACSVVTQLQTIVSREIHPIHPAVLTIGKIQGGTAGNVIADHVDIEGTLRTLDNESRQQSKTAIERIAKLTAEALRGSAEVTWKSEGLPVKVHDRQIIDGITASASKIIGSENIYRKDFASLGSEDFGVLFPKYGPGAQFGLGTQDPADPRTAIGLHNARNIFDERCLPIGLAILLQYTLDFLQDE